MKVVVAPLARRDIANQLGYVVDNRAIGAARRLERRITAYIENTIAQYPRTGVLLAHRNLREAWIPRTRLILWYRVEGDELQIVRVWHSAQDRQSSEGN